MPEGQWASVLCGALSGFGSASELHKVVLQKPVEEWGREAVQKWLNVLGMQRYEEQFRAIQGRVWPLCNAQEALHRHQLHGLVLKH